VLQRAAAAGLIRQAFYSEAEARDWPAGTLQVLADKRAWWAAQR
jgi:hypothetical protein